MRLAGVEHITLTVCDLDRSCTWYREVLGFEDVIRYRLEPIMAWCHVLSHPGAAGVNVGFRQYDEQDAAPFDEHRIGLDHVAFDVGDLDCLSEWHRHLDQLGVPYSHSASPGLAITALRDPDNIQVELAVVDRR